MEADDAMKISQFGEVNQILEDMLEGHKDIFSQKLLGYYVYGSFVGGRRQNLLSYWVCEILEIFKVSAG